jgi:hypothetical protein
MVLEAVQLLYTAHHLVGTANLPPDNYRSISNPSHPMAVWVQKSLENYLFTAQLAIELSQEYTNRYHKIHKCDHHAKWLLSNPPLRFETNDYLQSSNVDFGLDDGILTPVPLCMPDPIKNSNQSVVTNYRRYYTHYKKVFAQWKYTTEPWWYTPFQIELFF